MGIFDKINMSKMKDALKKSLTPKKAKKVQLRPVEIMARGFWRNGV